MPVALLPSRHGPDSGPGEAWAWDGLAERLALPLLVIDAEARVQAANPSALALCDRSRAIGLEQGQLTPRRAADRQSLAAAIRTVQQGAGQAGFGLFTRAGAPFLLVSLTMLPGAPARLLVSLAELTEVPTPDAATLARLLGLTRAEARVAALLANGHGGPAVARLLALRPETVRSHAKRVMAKLGCRSQSQLALVVSRATGGFDTTQG
jgi:DNA-binding NarL/FixJ family response regulator